MPINMSFPSPKPLPGKKKDFPSVSARINPFGDRKAVSKLRAPSVTGAPEKPSNGSKPANARATVRKTIKQQPQQPAKKDAAKPPQPEKTKPVPFRARPVPASTYKPPFQPTVRKINKAVIEKEQAPVAILNEPTIANEKEPAPVEIVNEPTIANEKEKAPVAILNEPTIAKEKEQAPVEIVNEPTIANGKEQAPLAILIEPTIANEKEQAPVEIVNEPTIAIDVEIAEPTHEAASCEPPKVNEPNGTNEDVCSPIESVNEPAEASSATEGAQCFYQHFPGHRVGDGALPRYDTQGYGDQSANVRVRNVRTRKPHKAEWNASYQRRLARRANERAERAAREQQAASTEISENTHDGEHRSMEAQREAAEAAVPQVPQ
ncbi:hypothetical protein OUZ56_003463 [Daphnia magna]|uniref:Uncharacterized protein n=1 Tax=Daphnia magna TaxID=35525 RepID=A0ABR0A983_9CRUS|nr:hypothetical protein OUZ56_003463 [Daphnia magna]